MSLEIVLISLVILPLTSYAQSSTVIVNTLEPVVCFTETDAKRIVVDLENVNDYREQVDLLKQANVELEKQIESLKKINKLQQEQLEISNQTIESYKKLLDAQRDAYETEIKKNKPSVLKTFFTGVGGMGIGILVGILL